MTVTGRVSLSQQTLRDVPQSGVRTYHGRHSETYLNGDT